MSNFRYREQNFFCTRTHKNEFFAFEEKLARHANVLEPVITKSHSLHTSFWRNKFTYRKSQQLFVVFVRCVHTSSSYGNDLACFSFSKSCNFKNKSFCVRFCAPFPSAKLFIFVRYMLLLSFNNCRICFIVISGEARLLLEGITALSAQCHNPQSSVSTANSIHETCLITSS